MKTNLLALFILLSLKSFAQEARYDTVRWAREHYQELVTKYNRESIRKNRIVFLGNSITEFADWRKLLNDSTVINRGIAADNTFGVLDRLEDVIVRKPVKVFLEIGINDIGQNIPLAIIRDNVIKIVNRFHQYSPSTNVYVTSILPINENAKKEYPELYHNDLIVQVNQMIEKESTTNKFTFINVNTALRSPNGTLSLEFANSDGVHLNEKGYSVWIKLLKAKGYL
jgi:lysophospholipase L1-like esterase